MASGDAELSSRFWRNWAEIGAVQGREVDADILLEFLEW